MPKFFRIDLLKFLEATLSLAVIMLTFSMIQGSFDWLFIELSVSIKFVMLVAITAFLRTYL